MKIRLRGQSAALSTAISVILGSSAAAQPPETQLEEIVVTAQRTETNLQQTPISVTAVSGEQLVQHGASSLLDLTSFIPNLQVGSTTLQGAGNGRFAIRGIGQEAGTGAAVGLYIDEVYYPTGAGNLMGLFDVDRVEVLRGPQGTLFGRNTIGLCHPVHHRQARHPNSAATSTRPVATSDARISMALLTSRLVMERKPAVRVTVGYNSRDGFVYDDLIQY